MFAKNKMFKLDKNKVLMGTNLKDKTAIINGQKNHSEEDLEDLDVEEIMKIYKTEDTIKKDDKEIQDQKLFSNENQEDDDDLNDLNALMTKEGHHRIQK